MAIDVSVLTTGSGSGYDYQYSTASVSPSAGSVCRLFISSTADNTDNVPTISGAYANWRLVASKMDRPDGNRMFAFEGYGAVSAGAISIDFGDVGDERFGCMWSALQIEGQAAFSSVQHVFAEGTAAAAATGTLNSFSWPENGAIVFGIVSDNDEAITPEAGFTELVDDGSTPFGAARFYAAWRPDNDTTPGFSWANSLDWVLYAEEIESAATGKVAISSAGSNPAPNNFEIAVDVTVAANDFLVGAFCSDSSSAPASPTYDAPLAQDYTAVTTVDGMRFNAASGRASGADTSLTINNGATTTQRIIGLIGAFSGVDQTTAKDVAEVTAESTITGVTSTAGMSITPITDWAMLVLVVGIDSTATTDPTFTVDDGGAGLNWSYVTAYEAGGFRKVAMAYARKPTAGAITVTGNFGLTAGYVATLYALRPSAGGGGGVAIPRHIRTNLGRMLATNAGKVLRLQ